LFTSFRASNNDDDTWTAPCSNSVVYTHVKYESTVDARQSLGSDDVISAVVVEPTDGSTIAAATVMTPYNANVALLFYVMATE